MPEKVSLRSLKPFEAPQRKVNINVQGTVRPESGGEGLTKTNVPII